MKRGGDNDTGGRVDVVMLHLEDRFESGPTWSLHKSGALGGVVCSGGFAEESQLVLESGQYMNTIENGHGALT